MFHLTQYIVVRRDLPLTDILPQAGHAAGKASFCYAVALFKNPPAGVDLRDLTSDWGHPTRIFKGAKNEARLRKLSGILIGLSIPHETIIEPDGALAGEMTALALHPGDKETLSRVLNDFQNLRWPDVPAFVAEAKALASSSAESAAGSPSGGRVEAAGSIPASPAK